MQKVHRDGRCVGTLIDLNDMEELQSALRMLPAATPPALELPTAESVS
jgi:hypothetical protein